MSTNWTLYQKRKSRFNLGRDSDVSLLEPDADEILLDLLARDPEQPTYHRQPHRRWVQPPAHGLFFDPYDGSCFCQVEAGWWRKQSREEQRELEKGRIILERERQERATRFEAQFDQNTPLDRWVENLRASGQAMPNWLNAYLMRKEQRKPDPHAS